MKNTSGFGIIGILLVIVSIGALAGGGYYTYQRIQASEEVSNQSERQSQQDPQPSSTQKGEEKCHDQDGIRVCVWLEDISPSYADGYRLNATFINTNDEIHSFTYNTTCTDPVRIINDEQAINDSMRMCGQALTTIDLMPSEKKI